jgi:hypothetical integral membrane protein (TIGR02206 family)
MNQFFAEEYTGAPFVFFGSAHQIALGIIGLIVVSLFGLRKSISERTRNQIRYGLAGLLIVNQIARHLWMGYYDRWSIQWDLPLHLCSIVVWVSAYMLITKNYQVFEFAYFMGIGGGMQALLTPDAGTYGFGHFYVWQFFIAHGSIIIASAYMAIVEGYSPTWASIQKVFVWGNGYMVVVTVINLIIGSNYLYTLHKPHVPTLLDYLGPWPWYILSAEGVALILCSLLYLPFLFSSEKEI